MAKKGEYQNLAGLRFGRWLVTELSKAPHRDANGTQHATEWWCKCECGTVSSIKAGSLRSGDSKSCGCLSADMIGERSTTHGMSRTAEHIVWCGVKTRTLNPNSKSFKDYGARGITVCNEWLNDFSAFLSHVGKRPSSEHTLERLDNGKGYEPGNVMWALRVAQANNNRSNVIFTIGGITKTLAQWCRELGRSYKTVHARIKAGWDPEQTILTPAGGCWNRQPSDV